MLQIDNNLTPEDLRKPIDRLWEVAGKKVLSIDSTLGQSGETPVFTVKGVYQPQGWTEWTQGFQFGCALLQFDATGDERFLQIGRMATLNRMPVHVTHIGVHDHGLQ